MVSIVRENANDKPFLLVSAGFSPEAQEHTRRTFEPFRNDFDVLLVTYNDEVRNEQKVCVTKSDRLGEYTLYKRLGVEISRYLRNLNINNVAIIAKSAGATVLSYLPDEIHVRAISLLAPAPVCLSAYAGTEEIVQQFACTRRRMPLLLGWDLNDPKIPRAIGYEVCIGFLKAGGYTVEFAGYNYASHDFNPEFVNQAIKRS